MNNTERAELMIKKSAAFGKMKASSVEPTEANKAVDRLVEAHNKILLDIAKQEDEEEEMEYGDE